MPRKSTRRRALDPDAPVQAVAYLRLSRKKKGTGDTEASLDTQAASCQRAIAALGGTIVATEQDVVSGDRLDRPGLWNAIDRITTGEANAIIVHSLDRFGRDQDQQGVAYVAIKRAEGRLLSATENLDAGPIGDFLRSAYSLAGALELAKIRERTNRAFAAKFAAPQKYKPGGVRGVFYGYAKIGNGAAATTAASMASFGSPPPMPRSRSWCFATAAMS
jgi:DNA invertase Pin-like site-specific DNA recombinase